MNPIPDSWEEEPSVNASGERWQAAQNGVLPKPSGTQLLVEQGTLGGAEHLPYLIIHMIDIKSYPCLLNVRVVSGISFTYIRRMLIGCAH